MHISPALAPSPLAPPSVDEEQAAEAAYAPFPAHREAAWSELWRERQQMRHNLQQALAPDQALEGPGNYAYQRAMGMARGQLTQAAILAAQCAGLDAWDTADMQQVRAAHWMALGREDLALPLVEGLLAARPAGAEALFELAAQSDAAQVAQRALAAGAAGAGVQRALEAVCNYDSSSPHPQAPLSLPCGPQALQAWCASAPERQALADAALVKAINLGKRAIGATLLQAGRPLPEHAPQDRFALPTFAPPPRGVCFVAARCPELLADCAAAGIALDVASADGTTPLHALVASRQATGPLVELLLTHGVDLEARNGRGETALSLAIRDPRGIPLSRYGEVPITTATIELLHSCGARSENVAQEVMVSTFCRYPEALGPTLLALGCSARDLQPSPILSAIARVIAQRTSYAGYPVDVPLQALVEQLHARVDGFDEQGNTALMLAAAAGQGDLVQVLLQLGANVHAFNDRGETALHTATKLGAIVEALLIAGADPERIDGQGNSPLALWEALARASMRSVDCLKDPQGASRVSSLVSALRRCAPQDDTLRLQLAPYPLLTAVHDKQAAEAKRKRPFGCRIM